MPGTQGRSLSDVCRVLSLGRYEPVRLSVAFPVSISKRGTHLGRRSRIQRDSFHLAYIHPLRETRSRGERQEQPSHHVIARFGIDIPLKQTRVSTRPRSILHRCFNQAAGIEQLRFAKPWADQLQARHGNTSPSIQRNRHRQSRIARKVHGYCVLQIEHGGFQ